jgi:hypothetical protein
MNSSAFKIESGVPLPQRAIRFPFDRMKVGDSILVDFDLKYRAKNAIGTYRKKVPGTRFATHTSDDGYRIWRTA